MSGYCNIATGKNSFAINITLLPYKNLTKSLPSNNVTNIENSSHRMAPLSASSASNVSGGGSASSCTNIAPPQPAVAHLGSDITQKPAVDIGISFGNINNHQGDTINNYYYRTPPGNENADGCQAGTVFGENATTTDQMMRTAYSSGRHDIGTSTDYRTQTRANIRVAIAKAENVLRRLDENGKRMQVVQHKAEGEARRCK